MITIALDEGGHFEKIDSTSSCMFVGGVIFKYKENNDCKNELQRLQRFFKETCKNENCKYPEDLHYNRVGGNVVNGGTANKVKNALIQALPDFLNGKGKWQNDAPNGTYYLYASVGDKNGIKSFTKSGISNLIDDNKSCNRYEHMAYRSVENLLFYNPCLVDNDVRLDLATRVIAVSDNEELEKEVRTTGHEKSKEDLYETVYKVTNQSSFRSAVATMIQDSNRPDIQFGDIRVESIYYHEEPTHNLYQGFLYLSDTICSLYSEILKGCNRAEIAAEQLWIKGQEYAKGRMFIWTYNDFDQKYRSIYKAYQNKDYFTTLSEMYKLTKEDEKNNEVYEALWFSQIKKEILFTSKIYDLSEAIVKLDNSLSYSEIPVGEARFIYELLKPRTEELCSLKQVVPILFHLYKAELAINNHEGNYREADTSFQKCMQFSQYVNIEEYLELRNMYSVSLCDSRDYDKAIQITEETLSWEELLVDAKKAIYKNNEKIFIHYGRTLSQLGQCYAFRGDFDKAIDCFYKAIDSFGDEKSEINRTISYLLHTAIEAKNIDVYEKYASQYFETNDRKEQLIRILSEENVPNYFALYVYIKAHYILYLPTSTKKVTEDILQKLEQSKKFKGIDNHPWELIFKYAAFLSVTIGNKEYRDKSAEFIGLAKKISNPEGILVSIIDDIEEQYKSVLEGKSAFENTQLSFMYR